MARRIAIYLGVTIATVLAVLTLGFALLQTGPGKSWLGARIGALLAGPGEHASVSRVTGLVPFDFRIGTITISDAAGPRMAISDAHIQLGLGALLARRLSFSVAATRVAVERPSTAKSQPTDWSQLLHPPLTLELARLDIGSLDLAAPVLGTALSVAASGSGEIGSGKANADLAVTRSDGPPGAMQLHLAYDGARLALHAEVSEPSGALLAGLLHSNEKLPLVVSVDGDGPLDAWHAKLAIRAGDSEALEAQASITGDNPYRLSLTGRTQAAALLPENLRPLLGDAVAFAAEIGVAPDGITLDRIALTTPTGSISAAGSYDWTTGGIAGSATLVVSDLAPAEPLLGRPLAGAGAMEITLGGTRAMPTLDAALQLENFATSEGKVTRARASLSLRPDGDPRTTPSALSASGHIEGLEPTIVTLPAGLGDALDWRMTANLDPLRQQIAASEIAVESAGNSFAAHATASRDGVAGEANLALADLARFSAGALSGALSITADFRAGADGTAAASLSGALDQPRTGIAQIDAALGPRIVIGAAVDRLADGAIESHDVALDGAALRVAGEARRGADDKIIADVTLSLPRLATLDGRVAGAATVTARVAGPSNALAGTVAIDAPGLAVAGERVDGFTVRAMLAALTPPAGHVEARFRMRGLDATATADGAMTRDGGWRVTRLLASAGSARIDGTAARVNGKLEGDLHGTVSDLGPLSGAAGIKLAGSAKIDAHLAGARASVTLDIGGLAAPEEKLAAQRLHLVADLADIFTRPTGHAEATITAASAGSATLSEGKLTATSDRAGHFALTLAARGSAAAPFTITGGAGLGIERGNIDLRIDRLAGAVGETKIDASAPLAIAWHDGSGRFTNLALRLGAGRLSGDGALERNTIALHLIARDLPVQALARLGGQTGAEGVLGFELTLSGTRTAPQGRLVIDGEELRFAAASNPDLPSFGLVTSAIWRDGRVDVQGRLSGPNNAAIGWRGSAPLVLAAQGLAVHLPPAGAVMLRLEGEAELAAIADLLPLGEDRVAGHVVVDASVAGTVEHPDSSGRLTVTKGRYENLATGVTLTGLGFALVGDRDHLNVRDFTAGDGANGSLNASGSIDLAAGTIEAAAEIKHFRALNRDEAVAVASGTLKLSGSVEEPRVDSALTIEEAEIAVPDRLPQSVRPVDAVIIDSATGATLTPLAPPSKPVLLAAKLAITIDLPGKVFVRGRGLDSIWRGRIVIAGSARAPILTGKLEVVNGTFDFIGKTLVLSSGTITFLGGSTIDPTIAIEAQAQSSDITAIVGIVGTATKPTITLSSVPQLPRDEILSRVLFGTSMSQISPAQGLELASAANALAGGPSLDVLGSIRRRLGLDRLSLGSAPGTVVPGLGVPGLSGQQATGPATGLGTSPLTPGSSATGANVSGTALNAGKYVANGVYVGVSQGLGASSSTVTATVDVTRHITLDTEAGQASGSGVGINWKLDY